MAKVNETEAREIGRAYLKKWRAERTAAEEKLPQKLKDFLVDCKKSLSENFTSELYDVFLYGLKDGIYKKPSDFFKAECSELFKGVIYPRREQVFYQIVDNIQDWAYSESSERRSLRTTVPVVLCPKIMEVVYTLYERDHIDADICDIVEGKNLTEEQMFHKEYFYSNFHNMDKVVAAEIDMGNERMIKLASEIIMYESEVPMSYMIISAVTKSHNADLHEKLGKLLLAARLQEGLRQSICETMDTGTKEAFFTLLDVIIENNLIRFSSVKRAVGVWLGFVEEETVKLERISDKSVKLIHDCIHDKDVCDKYLATEDTMKIYIALWAYGFHEAFYMLHLIKEYALHGSKHQIMVAGYMTAQFDNVVFMSTTAMNVIEEHKNEPEILAVYMKSLMCDCMRRVYYFYGNSLRENSDGSVRKYAALEPYFNSREEAEKMYGILLEIYKGMSKKSVDFSPCIFPWNSESLMRSDVAERLAYIASALHDNDKIDFVASLIPQIDYFRNSVVLLLLAQPETDEQRRILTAEVCDKEEYTRREAFKLINQIELAEENYRQLEDMLRYKNADMRSNCIKLLMKQNDDALFGSIAKLISDKKEEKRTAALDIIIQLSKDESRMSLFNRCIPLVKQNESTSAAERILIENILPSEKSESDIPALYSDKDIYTPVIDEKFIEKAEQVFRKYFNGNEEDKPVWRTALAKLDELVEAHADEEFRYGYGGEIVTLGTAHSLFAYENGKRVMPFNEYWDKFYDEEIKTPVTLFKMMVSLCSEGEYDEYSVKCNKILEDIIGKQLTVRYEYKYFMKLFEICEYLLNKHSDKVELFYVSAAFINRLMPIDNLSIKFKVNVNGTEKTGSAPILSYYPVRMLLSGIERTGDNIKLASEAFPLKYAFEQKDGFTVTTMYGRAFYLTTMPLYHGISVHQYIHAAYHGIITEAQLYRILFTEQSHSYYSSPILGGALSVVSYVYAGARELEAAVDTRERSWERNRKFNEFRSFINSDNLSELTEEQKKLITFAEKLYRKMTETILAKELKRGDLETEYSGAIDGIKRIYGIDHLVKILCALGELPLERSLYGNTKTKKGALSHLLSVCLPEYEDNAEKLKSAVKGTGISEKRLIEAAMYSPEWLPMVGEYLGWEGFSSACYYFIAHMNEKFDDKRKAVIAKYTPLTDEELNAGAFDISWFRAAYDTLGKKRFDMIYDAAKYISDGAKHSRARKYADAVLGKFETAETVKTIADKRNKDLLMAYALIPIKNEDDICNRYLYLQQFLKESKKFGSQRSASEKKAVEIAMQNLSINAGYADVTRLTLRMETKLIDDSRELFEDKEIDGTIFRLAVDDTGKAEIICTKDGKQLKSVPAKLKKNEYIVRLTETKKKLVEQYRRTRVMFEQAMENSTEFTVEELNILRRNPVVLPIIKNLVFVCGHKLGFLDGNELTDYAGNIVKLSYSDKVIAAHPYAIYKDGHWSDYQRHLFDKQLVQPFRQVFRELYVKTADEAEMTHSLRYAGNQIQPAKTVACLKTRRWVADVEDGLQKVYYKENIVARIYAIADWFTPADIEAPTLEWVEFTDRKTGRVLVIKDIPDIIFSEVMRDVDMAVSVAHAGGVDPETSHSTVEMRAAIIEFTLPLFKLTNVEIKGNHAHISGKYGEYTLHLGSGVIHKKGGAMINILPVHSQHRGKIFLPFADEDPKTAEIITKMLFLAEDSKIKDPSILAQIR